MFEFLCFKAHDSPVRTMVWSHNESWMVTGDHAGYVKYWQSNMNNVKMFQAHKEAIRGLRYSIYQSSPYIYRQTVPREREILTCLADSSIRDLGFIYIFIFIFIKIKIFIITTVIARPIVWVHR